MGPASAASPAGASAPQLTIREAREADIDAILEIVEAAYRGEGGWTTESHLVQGDRSSRQEVRELLADDEVTLLVAEAPAQVAGCCYTRLANGRAELGLFAVAPAAQSGGIGGRLLEAQADRLAAAGASALMIQVLQSRPELHAWYRRHGFRVTGLEHDFPGDPARLAVQGLRMVEMVRPLQGP